jgi:hypothetical protein
MGRFLFSGEWSSLYCTKHCDLGNIDTEGEEGWRVRGIEGQRDVCVCGDQYRPGTIPLLGAEDKKGTVSQI